MGIKESRPVYLQLAAKLMDDVVSGRIAPDERVPSVREFAADNQVNVNTAIRAYDYLATRAIIYTRRGMGYFACADGAQRVASLRRDEFMHNDMDIFFRQLHSFGMTPDQLALLYAEFLHQHSKKQTHSDI